ncbi:MAG: bifunctional lysylphosphatidylglycerol flippase/synthetase MprF [Cellulosilyticaceae bacterium]
MSKNEILTKCKQHKLTLCKYTLWMIVITLLLVGIIHRHTSFNLSLALDTLYQQPIYYAVLYFILGLIAVSATTLYDFILCHDFHLKITPSKIFKISWLADVPLIFAEEQAKRRGGLRYLLYKFEGIEPKKASLISKVKDLFLIGDLKSLPKSFKLNILTRVKLIISFMIKWLAAAFFFTYIFSHFTPDLPYLKVLFIFGCAMIVANTLLIPAGFGIFELGVIYGCLVIGIPLQVTVLPLVIFRMFYYIIPWFITMVVLSRTSSTSHFHKLTDTQKHFLTTISIKALAALIFFSGWVLILSASLPGDRHRLALIASTLPLGIVHFSRILTLGIGILLVVLSKGIWDKVIASYYTTLCVLFIGAVFALLKDFNIEIAFMLLLTAWALRPTKHAFYRMSTKLTLGSFIYSLGLVILSSIVFVCALRFLSPSYTLLSSTKPTLYTYLELGTLIFFIIAASILLTLLSAKHATFASTTEEDLEKLKKFLATYTGNSMTHLIFLKDKSLFYSMDDQVLIAFRPHKDKLIVLGDPIGEVTLFKDAINAFRLFADQYHMTPIFYEINEDFLPIYHENGFKFLKLGEEATMNLSEFTLVGKKGAALRTIKNKMLRGELTFELLQNPIDAVTMDRLKALSDLWLEGRREKEFSLGSFDEAYINLAPVGIVKQDDEIIAFVTIMPMYCEKTVSIDLMRLLPNPPNGTMDALFIGLIEWAIDEGYEKFVLGKAPLSNVGYTQFSPTKEKIVKYIYNYGNKIYSFKGLRRYKEKFYPHWKGIYLAYPKHTNLSMALIQLTKMISGSSD